MRDAPRQRMTPAEYVAWERDQVDKHEFDDGEVFTMAGGSAHLRRDQRGAWAYAVAEAGGRVALAIGADLEVDAVYEGAFDLRGDEDSP